MIDPTLRDLVLAANHLDIRLEAVLTVGGLLVSGDIVSFTYWGQALKDQGHLFAQEQGADPHVARSIGSFMGVQDRHLEDASERRRAVDALLQAAGDDEAMKAVILNSDEDPYFVHMVNVSFFGAGVQPVPSGGSGIWRGRLESVDGWSRGKFALES